MKHRQNAECTELFIITNVIQLLVTNRRCRVNETGGEEKQKETVQS